MVPESSLRSSFPLKTLASVCRPGLVMTQNDRVHRCLIAQDVIEDPVGTLFHHAGLLSIYDGYFNCYWFRNVLLSAVNGLHRFVDGDSGMELPQASMMAPDMIPLEHSEYYGLVEHLEAKDAWAVFNEIGLLYGQRPGFTYVDGTLTSPELYCRVEEGDYFPIRQPSNEDL